MKALSTLEQDALTEIFNIGVGQAAASLSELVKKEVKLSVPEVEVLSRKQAAQRVSEDNAEPISGVKESFDGLCRGDALLFFAEEKSLELVRLILDDSLPLEVLSEMEQEALTEVGNIILTGCLSGFADTFHEEIRNGLPEYTHGTADAFFYRDEEKNRDPVMFLKMMFDIQEKNIHGYISFLMDIEAMEQFREKIAETFGLAVE